MRNSQARRRPCRNRGCGRDRPGQSLVARPCALTDVGETSSVEHEPQQTAEFPEARSGIGANNGAMYDDQIVSGDDISVLSTPAPGKKGPRRQFDRSARVEKSRPPHIAIARSEI